MASKSADKRYTKDHEWVVLDGDIATVGITDHAQEQLGDLVHVELPDLERYIQCSTLDDAYRYGEPLWDGVAILATSSLERCLLMLSSPVFTTRARPHADKFLERIALAIVHEVRQGV